MFNPAGLRALHLSAAVAAVLVVEAPPANSADRLATVDRAAEFRVAHCCHAHPYAPYDNYCCHPASTTVYVAPRPVYGVGPASVRGVARRTSRRTARRVSRRR
ncbi:MAG: hypothetical protein OEM91_13670 [Hyphomicrobiales bacterium]|nr:hypothetical protein [Hyphomicrobiales bacterium]